MEFPSPEFDRLMEGLAKEMPSETTEGSEAEE